MAKFTGGSTPIDLTNFNAELTDLDDGATSSIHTTTQFRRDEVIPTDYVDFFGKTFTYDGSNILNGGTINRIVSFANSVQWDLSSVSLTKAQIDDFITKGNGQSFLTTVFAGNDSITGSAGDDTLQGFAGNDSFNGGKGDDVYYVDDAKDVVTESLTLAAGGGTDLVISKGTFTLGTNVDNLQLVDGAKADGTGNAIANALTGNAQDNKLTGLAGDDTLIGNGGNDTLDGGAGNDSMVGGAGDDFYIQDSAGDSIDENGANTGLGDTLKTNQNTLPGPVPNIEHYIFTGAGAVNFTGDGADNSITGAGAADSLAGGGGNDTLIGLVGKDSMDGGAGDDVYVVDNAGDSVIDSGGVGDTNDTVRASITVTLASFLGIENIELTGAGAINATGDGGANRLTGNAGANKLDGQSGADTMDGGKGNDIYVVDNIGDQVSEDTLTGGGVDTVQSAVSYTLGDNIENLTLAPGLANINATGNGLANTLTGNDGNNVLDGGGGIDKLIGGKGDDTYIVYDTKTTVTESVAAGGGVDLVKSSATFTLGTNVENLELLDGKDADGTGNALANALAGNAQNNKLSGAAGDDVLDGGAGNDTLDGGAGNDTMTGGLGDDVFIVDSAGDKVNADTGGTDELRTNQLLDKAVDGIENYTFTGTKSVIFDASDDNTDNKITGTSAADVFRAKGGDDFVAGLAGNDSLVGDDGNDTLDGGAGADTMDGGDGDDTYFVDNVKDFIVDTKGNDTVKASVSFDLSTFGADIENAELTGAGALNLTGDDSANKLTGNAGANKIDGRGGADTMAGAGGNDTYIVDHAGDKVTEKLGEGTDLVQSGVSFALGDNLENLTLTGGNAINGTGNTLGNLITGNGANNILLGGAVGSGNDTTPNGNDTLIGNGGDDSLWGGAGVDSLSGGDGNDTLDGGASIDKADLDGDKMAGGAGDDWYYVNTAKDVVTEAANAGRDTIVANGVGWTLGANFEDLVLLKETRGIGNTLNNTITGSEVTDAGDPASGADSINGLAGNDTLYGKSGDDTLIGFSGNDSIDGGDGVDEAQFAGKIDDYIISAPDKDGRITVTDKNISANGNDGVDTLINVERLVFLGSNTTYEVHALGTDKDDVVLLSSAPDGYDGLEGNDSIDGDGGNDSLDGDGGNDTLVGGSGDDRLSGGTGTDQYNHSGTSADGADIVFTGEDGVDTLLFTGKDLFDLGFSRDNNNLTVGALKSAQSFDGSVLVVDHYNGGAIGTVLIDTLFNNLYGTNSAQAKFVFTTNLASGIDNADYTEVLLGTSKSDVINGNGGFLDILVGGAGNDTLNGGTGTNLADYSKAATSGIIVDLSAGKATNDGDGGQDTLISIQNVRGSQFDDDITGDAGNNVFQGGAGNDTIDGGGGIDQAVYSDALSGVSVDLSGKIGTAVNLSTGSDHLFNIERILGSQLNDTIVGNADVFTELVGSAGNDSINGDGNGYAGYYDSPGAVNASLAGGTATDGWGGKDTLSGLIGLSGSAFNDTLTGNTGNNWFEGGKGNDSIDGGTGVADVVDYSKSTAGVTVDLGAGTAKDGFGGTDTLKNIEWVTGSAFNDTLTGSSGANSFTGGAGNDSIVGGGGIDTAVFSGNLADYTVTFDGKGGVTVTDKNLADGNDGADRLTGIEALKFADQSIAVDQPPDITSGTAFPVVENTKTVGTVTATDPDVGDIVTFSISGTDASFFTIDSATGALSFKAAPDFESPQDSGKDNVYDLTVTASDGLLVDTQAIKVTVTNANEVPTITSGTGFSVAENGAAVGTMTATDPDAGDKLTFSISGTDAALFTIDSGTGALSFKAAPNFESPQDAGKDNVYNLTVTAKDSAGLTDVEAITVTVTNVNEPPAITSNGGGDTAAVNAAENQTAVTTVVAGDPDAGTTLTYSISGGADAALFTINSSTGALAFKSAPDFETKADSGGNGVYDVTVRASDGTLFDTQAIAVTVTNVNEPVGAISDMNASANTVAENSVAGTLVGVTAQAVDPDGDTVTYSLSSDESGGGFKIDAASGIVTVNDGSKLDFETDSSYVITVKATSSDGSSTTKDFTITLTDVAEPIGAVSDTNPAANSVPENATAGTLVGLTVFADDPDAGDTVTYSLTKDESGGGFKIDSATGVVSVADGSKLDFEADPSHVITAKATSSDGSSSSKDFTIALTNVNEAPVITSNGGGTGAALNVAENTTAVTTVAATDVDAGTTLAYSISGGADAALFTINSSTGALSFLAAPNFETKADAGANGVYDVTVKASDGTLFDTQDIAVTVTNVNEPPVIGSNGGGATAAVNAAENQTVVTTVVATDVDAGTTLTYSISGGADAALFTINSSTGALSFLAAPDFETKADAGANGVYDVQVKASDGTLSDTQDIAVTVTNVNEAPVIGSNGGGASAALNVAENTTAVTTVTATDVDVPTTLTYSISGGADAAFFTINSSTGALSFITAPDFETKADAGGNGVYDVTVKASDGTLFDTQDIAVTVTATNEAPVITSNSGGPTASVNVAENSTAVTTVTATDPDAGTTLTYSISGGADAALFTINSSSGALSFISAPNFESKADSGANGVYDVQVKASDGTLFDTQDIAVTVTNVNEAPVITSNSGGATAAVNAAENQTAVTTVVATDVDASTTITYSISGGADAAFFTINSSSGALNFLSAPNFESKADAGANGIYDVTVKASDGTLFDTQDIAVTVTNVNEAPTITSNSGGPTATVNAAENQTAVTTVVATDVDASTTITYSISGGADAAKFTINSTTGALSFITAPDFETKADAGGNGVYDVQVKASDGTLFDTQDIAVTVTNGNEPPAITSNGGGSTAAVDVAENSMAVTTVTASDPDAGATLTYSISGGNDASLFTINSSTGALSFISAPNFESPQDVDKANLYDVQVKVSDGTFSDTQSIAVNVTDVNEAPVITSNGGGATATVNAAENQTAVTTVVATDVDAGTTLTYSISGGLDQALFDIDPDSGALTFKSAPNFEAPTDNGGNNVYNVTVKASDGSLSDTQDIAITVTNVNETPTITSNGAGASATVNAAENQTVVTTVVATDVDASTTITYSISGGADAAFFTINSSSGALSFLAAPNFESKADSGGNGVYDVTVKASDGALFDTQDIAVTVTNVNEAPTITSNSGGATAAVNAAENQTAVTTVVATDVDASTTITYSISGGADAALFTINSSSGALSFLVAPDFETKADAGGNGVYDVTVKASDGALFDTQDIAVTVTNVNEAPTITSNAGGATATVNAAENQTAVTTVVATDVDASTTITYSISGGADAAFFTINSTSGVLSFLAAPDFETKADAGGNGVYDVTVKASDGTLFDTQDVAVTVTNVNEAPTITSNGGNTTATVNAAENQTTVTTVVATDVDASTTITYSISGGADSAFFTINSSSGALSFLAPPNFESKVDAGANGVYDVTVKASDGTLFDTQDIAVTVTNVNEAPTITSNSGGATATVNAAENQTAVTTVVATDVDASTTITYSISGGADAAFFTINASSGALSFLAAPNFESKADAGADGVYDVTVKASDGALFDTQDIAVTVTNVNEAPTITSNGAGASASLNVTENTTAVTTVVATDVDAGTTLTYSISGGADAALFTINASSGALSFITAPDFETKADAGGNGVYDVTVKASDGTLFDTQDIAVTVTNANEAPTITSNGGNPTATVNAAENQTIVTTVIATDVDASTTLTYSISGGADAAFFTINSSSGALSFIATPDFETKADAGGNGVYDVTVKASDGTLFDTQDIAVTVTNVDEPVGAVSDTNGTANTVAENATTGTLVGITAFADDPDAGQTVSYSLTKDESGGGFKIDASSGIVSVDDGSKLDFETDSSHVITVKATSTDGTSSTHDFTITVSDVIGETLTGDGNANKLVGGIGDDSLSGAGGSDTLIGGADNDTLDGGAGIDQVLGGSGDDTLVLDTGDSTLDGGSGTDTLLVQSGDLDLTAVPGVVTNIERIDLGAGDPGHQLTLTAQDVLDVTDSGDTLTIDGDGADTLNLTGVWVPVGVPSGGHQTYTQVAGLDAATIVVDTDIQIVTS